jgi:hypothetical protein
MIRRETLTGIGAIADWQSGEVPMWRRAAEEMGCQMMRTCGLDALVGATTLCTEGDCPFWEPGGAVLEGRCAFEKLDLTRRPAVVAELLRLREVLAAAAPGEDGKARHSYHRLLNESGEE